MPSSARSPPGRRGRAAGRTAARGAFYRPDQRRRRSSIRPAPPGTREQPVPSRCSDRLLSGHERRAARDRGPTRGRRGADGAVPPGTGDASRAHDSGRCRLMPIAITPIAQGLRERKKQKTRESIQREAMRLIEKQGYDQTTIEQIAAAVEISPSTFFNYFPSKEDVVLYDAYDPVLAKLMLERPADEPLSISFRRVLEEMGGIFDRDRSIILARGRLWFEVPALRARLFEELEKAQVFMTAQIAQRSGREVDDFETRVAVMVMVAAAMEAMREWMRRDGKGSFFALINQALELVAVGSRLDEISRPP